MNSEIRDLVTDLKAATRIGHADSLNTALDDIAQWDTVASNQVLETSFIEKAILPLGAALNAPQVQEVWLSELAGAPLAALRAMAAVALAQRYLTGEQELGKELRSLSKDERPDVRQTLVTVLLQAKDDNQDVLLSLAREWLSAASPRTRAAGLQLLSNTAFESALPFLDEAHHELDPDVRRALADTLLAIAAAEPGQSIIQLLENWATDDEPNVWVISKTLSGSWAVAHLEAAEAILDRLAQDEANAKRVESARKALARHQNN